MNNEKGITMIEVLAAAAIFAVVSSLVFGIFISTQKNYRQAGSRIQLGQEAEAAISTLKAFHQKEDHYWLSYDSSAKKAFIRTDHLTVPLTSGNVLIDLEAGQEKADRIDEELKIDCSEPLFISIKLHIQEGKPYETNIIINKY